MTSVSNHHSKNYTPNISVLLPVYNGSKYIYEAINSILTQNYTNFELLVLDDASKDDTIFIVESFNDSRIRLFKESSNMGIVHQLNKGLTQARGHYIARMDADDVAYPDRLFKQLAFLESNSSIDIVGCQAEKFGDATGFIKHPTSPRCIDFLLNFYCSVLHPTVMMRSSIFREKKIQYENIPYAEDYNLWIKISNGKNIANLEEVLMKYRIHDSQTNKIKFDEQYKGALSAREKKLSNTLRFCSHKFIDRINRLSNDYIFYGETNMPRLKVGKLYEQILFRLLIISNRKCKKPIVDFVLNNI